MANPAMKSMFNVAVGSFIPDLYADPEARQRIRQSLSTASSVRNLELPMHSASGAVRDYLGSFMQTDYEGESAVLGWLLDITDIKSAEQSARLAQAAACEASRVKSNFLANMSHEIRTHLNAIIGLSGLAIKNEMPPRLHDYLNKIRRSGEHLLGIINDVLDFSKIESGKLEMESIAFDVESVIENVVNLIARSAEDKGLELLCSVDFNIPRTLIGDPLRIGQILINYANNAVKFTKQGEVRIAIAIREHTPNAVRLHFSVTDTDTGIGLSDEQMGRLFTSFVQADSSTTRNYGGTGLGLAVSKSLAQAMGGQVGVQSTLGQGATFWFTASFGVGSEERMRAQPNPDLRGRRVLLVDDSEASALRLTEMLAELGFVVVRVRPGADALHAVRQADSDNQPFEFLIVDWIMPAMDRLETVQAIQNLQPKTAPFVIMVTAHRRAELVQGAERLGIDQVLAKPVNSSLLLNTLMQVEGLLPSSPLLTLPASGHSALEARLSQIGGARILLVENNEINQQVACELLWDVGFEVDLADNGQLALHSVEARSAEGLPYDIVLMDMQMPVMDGVTAARRIRETRSSDELPIVAVTTNAMQADRDRCMAAGMNGFVTKPINPEELWQALLTSVKVRQGHGPVSRASPAPQLPGADAQLADLLQALRSIPELDVNQGLMRTNQNPPFYASMRRKLVASQADAKPTCSRVWRATRAPRACGIRPTGWKVRCTRRHPTACWQPPWSTPTRCWSA
jgi:two-component system sensor histidine kinase/response regulator